MVPPSESLALVLSGGGVRAMMFHLGVMRYMAEHKMLERVGHVSTVSGGSLLVGLILQANNMLWPDSHQFLTHVLPQLRTQLCKRSLQWDAARQLLWPRNWRFMLSRANVLALALRKYWGIDAQLSDLPAVPEISINGTTAETGKRFRFKRTDIGDYTLGYAKASDFPLACALAVSAAFPGAFGPLTLRAKDFVWIKRPTWSGAADTAQAYELPYQRVHLYDGGIYDNLGLEPFFDAGEGRAKKGLGPIIVSDAGAPLKSGFSLSALNPKRLMRINDIISDQSRALRVRTFAAFLKGQVNRGAYLYINTPISGGASCPSQAFAAAYATTLARPTPQAFDQIVAHGREVTAQVHRNFGLPYA